MTESPLVAPVLFHLGPVPITGPVVTTWCLIAGLTVVSHAITRSLRLHPSRWQAVLEILVTTIEDQITETMQTAGRPFVPLLGTLFIFLAFANVLGILPGVKPPTASIATAAALALIVFLAVHVYGLRRRGLTAYLGSYANVAPAALISRLLTTAPNADAVVATVQAEGRDPSGFVGDVALYRLAVTLSSLVIAAALFRLCRRPGEPDLQFALAVTGSLLIASVAWFHHLVLLFLPALVLLAWRQQRPERLGRAWSQVSHLNAVANSPELREAYNTALPKVTQYFAEQGQDLRLHAAFKAMAAAPGFAQWPAARRRFVEIQLRDFRLTGAELPPREKARFLEIQEEWRRIAVDFADEHEEPEPPSAEGRRLDAM